MSIPTIPNIEPTISLERGDVVNLLIASVALEELGLAHIINAEAEKIQFILGTLAGTEAEPPVVTFEQIIELNTEVGRILTKVIAEEILLAIKLQDAVGLISFPT